MHAADELAISLCKPQTVGADKLDFLYEERLIDGGIVLRQIFDDAHFLHDLDASLTVAEWQYETAERTGALAWLRKKGETVVVGGEWRAVLSS